MKNSKLKNMQAPGCRRIAVALLLVLHFTFLIVNSSATLVRFTLPDQSGTNNFRIVGQFQSLGNPSRSGTNLFMADRFSVTFTNAGQVLSLQPGDWTLRIGNLSTALTVPETNIVVESADIAGSSTNLPGGFTAYSRQEIDEMLANFAPATGNGLLWEDGADSGPLEYEP